MTSLTGNRGIHAAIKTMEAGIGSNLPSEKIENFFFCIILLIR